MTFYIWSTQEKLERSRNGWALLRTSTKGTMELAHALCQACLLLLCFLFLVPLLNIGSTPGNDVLFVDALCDSLRAGIHWVTIRIDGVHLLLDSTQVGILIGMGNLIFGLIALRIRVEFDTEVRLVLFDVCDGTCLSR